MTNLLLSQAEILADLIDRNDGPVSIDTVCLRACEMMKQSNVSHIKLAGAMHEAFNIIKGEGVLPTNERLRY